MRNRFLLLLAAALPTMATDLPPAIPTGPVTYDSVSYDNPEFETGSVKPALTPAAPTYIETPSSAAGERGYVNLNAYTSNYQVRGMGFTDNYTQYGYSSVSGSYTFPNRNLFGLGLQQRIGGEYGVIWDASDLLGDAPLVRFDYAIGKEIFPNLLAEVGYTAQYGGMEGFMARANDDCPHRFAENVNAGLRFDDRQRGFFGHALCGLGFQGLTGLFFDIEAGYRFARLIHVGNWGADVELSAGLAPSLSYWGSGVEGVDAYRLKVALPLFTQNGRVGHDGRFYVKPWASTAWSGSNARKIDRNFADGPIDHFQFTVGVDCGWKF